MSQIHWSVPVAPAGSVGTETSGCEPMSSLVTPGSPNGTGIADIASGYEEAAPPEAEGAFCAPRTDDGDPRGSVQRAPVFTGGRFVLWSGPILWVPP
jgi:hypothetical protein